MYMMCILQSLLTFSFAVSIDTVRRPVLPLERSQSSSVDSLLQGWEGGRAISSPPLLLFVCLLKKNCLVPRFVIWAFVYSYREIAEDSTTQRERLPLSAKSTEEKGWLVAAHLRAQAVTGELEETAASPALSLKMCHVALWGKKKQKNFPVLWTQMGNNIKPYSSCVHAVTTQSQ